MLVMELTEIKTEEHYEQYLDWVDEQFDKKVSPDTREGKKLEIALVLIKQFEDEHHPISFPDL